MNLTTSEIHVVVVGTLAAELCGKLALNDAVLLVVDIVARVLETARPGTFEDNY
jgi:hypothetical protein